MKFFDKSVYSILNLARNKNTIKFVNKLGNIDNSNLILPRLYLGNIEDSKNLTFFKDKDINAIVNCTENEPFHEYFNDKPKLLISINDSRNPEYISKFKSEIIDAIDFIDGCIEENKNVYVHCHWGLMRSATVVAAYIIKKYKISKNDAINVIKECRPYSLSSYYNFNEVLEFVENKYLHLCTFKTPINF